MGGAGTSGARLLACLHTRFMGLPSSEKHILDQNTLITSSRVHCNALWLDKPLSRTMCKFIHRHPRVSFYVKPMVKDDGGCMVASSAPAFPVSHSLTGARHGRPLPLLPLPGHRKSGWADPRCFTMRRRRLQWSACILGILGVQWPGKQFICLKFVSSPFLYPGNMGNQLSRLLCR